MNKNIARFFRREIQVVFIKSAQYCLEFMQNPRHVYVKMKYAGHSQRTPDRAMAHTVRR